MLATVFFSVPFNKKPYVSLLGGTFFIALRVDVEYRNQVL